MFKDITMKEFNDLYETSDIQSLVYKKGDLIGDDRRYSHSVGILISGKLNAMKYSIKGKPMFLRTINNGDIFGIANVFNKKATNVSFLEVAKESNVAYISEQQLLSFFKNEQILNNYLTYVNSKIVYLNEKIEIISQDTARDRILVFIYNQWLIQNQSKQIEITMTKSDLADYLGISRASLYRIIDKFKAENKLIWDKNRLEIKSDLTKIV